MYVKTVTVPGEHVWSHIYKMSSFTDFSFQYSLDGPYHILFQIQNENHEIYMFASGDKQSHLRGPLSNEVVCSVCALKKLFLLVAEHVFNLIFPISHC